MQPDGQERTMQERDTVQTDGVRMPRMSTGTLAIVGSSLFVSGLFVLAAAGHAYPWLTHLFILGSAVALSLPLLGITALVAASEAAVGRAWANGLHRLGRPERGFRATSVRAVRYASVLWIANGAAMWLATLVAQM